MSSDVAERFAHGEWAFTPEVVDVFDEHVRASVPHYDVVQQLVVAASDWLLPHGGVVADLGASTGTTVAAILERHPSRELSMHLYDESTDMLRRAETKIGQTSSRSAHVRYHARRIEAGPLDHSHADLTLSLFTLQFLPYADRVETLRLARAAAAPAGALLVAEKLRLTDTRWSEIACDLSHDWKAQSGITDGAIRAKAQALRGVLRPYSIDALQHAVTDAGWTDVETIWRWHQWVLLGAFATHDGYA